MNRLRFGVIGCGGISTVFQLPALRRSHRVKLVAVADVDHDHVCSVARRFNVPQFYTDYHDMIGQIDAALVATPNATHADIACALLEHGVHVLCEKPMATNLADVQRMQNTARSGGARLMAGQSLRFAPHVTMLKQIVDEGWIGNLREIWGALGGPYSDGVHRTDFRRQKSLSGGGVLMDLGVHLIDFSLWLTGDIPKAIAYYGSTSPGWEVESNAEVALEFDDGSCASLFCSLTHSVDCTLMVKGDSGWARAPAYDPTNVFLFSDQASICRRSGMQQVVLPNTMSQYDRQIDHFSAAVLSGDEFVVRDAEIRAGIRVVEECYATTTLAEASQE